MTTYLTSHVSQIHENDSGVLTSPPMRATIITSGPTSRTEQIVVVNTGECYLSGVCFWWAEPRPLDMKVDHWNEHRSVSPMSSRQLIKELSTNARPFHGEEREIISQGKYIIYI